MPKKPMDYSKCLIYKIVCNDLLVTYCYVGRTTNFKHRKSQHKCSCNNETSNSKCKVYDVIRDNGGWDNWSMIEIQKYPCKDIYEAIAKEREWYEILNANLNGNIPNRTHKERYEANKEKILEKANNNYKENKEKKLLYSKQYYEKNKISILNKAKEKYVCDCGSICCIYDKSKHFKSAKHQIFLGIKSKK